MRVFLSVLVACLIVLPAHIAGAQPLRGMVWEPPVRTDMAEADLIEMHRIGVQGVRTPLLRNERLYRVADSLGIVLYQDLPFQYLAGGELQDTLQYARQVVQEALWWARDHPSARFFGLGRQVDTSDEETCEALRAMAEPFRQSDGRFGLYYLTAFVTSDRCASVVDLVLLDALDSGDSVTLLRRWQRQQPAFADRAGIGQFGTWVLDGRDEDGTRVPHSRSYQARYLENELSLLLADTLRHPPEVLFVFSWRDVRFDRPSLGHDLTHPYAASYGLHSVTGERRLALAVVEGIYSGRQSVFAFPPGNRPSEAAPLVILLGWGVLLLLGFAYFRYARFQSMVRRYFFAHGFYRESIAHGRELMFGSSALVLSALVIAAGLVSSVILEAVREQPAFVLLARSLPETLVLSMVAVLDRPLTMTLLMGSLFALGVLVWTSVLSALSTRNRQPLLPGQALVLVAWPRWTLFVLMLAAMVVSTLRQPEATFWAVVISVAVLLAGVAANMRTLNDYRLLTRSRWPRLLVALAGNPLMLLVMITLYLAVRYHDRMAFFWHLMVRG